MVSESIILFQSQHKKELMLSKSNKQYEEGKKYVERMKIFFLYHSTMNLLYLHYNVTYDG